MRYLLLLLSLILFHSCEYAGDKTYYDTAADSANWRRLDFGPFSVSAPGDWVRYSLRGIDSYVGGISNGKDSLEFDYGPYSADVSASDAGTGQFAKVTIDGFPAIIRIPYKGGEGTYEMHIDLDGGNKLSFNGYLSDTRTALAIYQSLQFHHGHRGKTDSLSRGLFSDAFPGTAHTGKLVFYEYCAICHNRYKQNTGPPLTPEFLKPRSDAWVFRFLTNRASMKHDTLWLKTWREYNKVDCQYFDSSALTRYDVNGIMEWLREDTQGY